MRGKGNFGDESGASEPSKSDINIAVPSLTVRKRDKSDMSHTKLSPGFIEESIEAMQDAGITQVNVGRADLM